MYYILFFFIITLYSSEEQNAIQYSKEDTINNIRIAVEKLSNWNITCKTDGASECKSIIQLIKILSPDELYCTQPPILTPAAFTQDTLVNYLAENMPSEGTSARSTFVTLVKKVIKKRLNDSNYIINATFGKYKAVKLPQLLSTQDMEQEDENEESLFSLAIDHCEQEVIMSSYLPDGAYPKVSADYLNKVRKDGDTFLLRALKASGRVPEIIGCSLFLMVNDQTISHRDKNGQTPLQLAEQHKETYPLLYSFAKIRQHPDGSNKIWKVLCKYMNNSEYKIETDPEFTNILQNSKSKEKETEL